MKHKSELGIIIGNVYAKHETKNPVAQALFRGFLNAFDDLTAKTTVTKGHEIGCGEGFLSKRLADRGWNIRV